jgi:hypothetical protein
MAREGIEPPTRGFSVFEGYVSVIGCVGPVVVAFVLSTQPRTPRLLQVGRVPLSPHTLRTRSRALIRSTFRRRNPASTPEVPVGQTGMGTGEGKPEA